jgi:hypothetical protein
MKDFSTATMVRRTTDDGPPLVLLRSLLADRSSFSDIAGPLSR